VTTVSWGLRAGHAAVSAACNAVYLCELIDSNVCSWRCHPEARRLRERFTRTDGADCVAAPHFRRRIAVVRESNGSRSVDGARSYLYRTAAGQFRSETPVLKGGCKPGTVGGARSVLLTVNEKLCTSGLLDKFNAPETRRQACHN
jgi:hypothetical protein